MELKDDPVPLLLRLDKDPVEEYNVEEVGEVMPLAGMLEDAGVTDADDKMTLLDKIGVVIPIVNVLEDAGVEDAEEIVTLLDMTEPIVVGP